MHSIIYTAFFFFPKSKLITVQLACLHDQNKSGFFGGPAFFQPIRVFWKLFQIVLIGWIKAGPLKSHFCFAHVNWLNMFLGNLRSIKRVLILPVDKSTVNYLW